MKTTKTILLALTFLFASIGAQAKVQVISESFKIDAATKKVDLSEISTNVKVEKAELPIEQLSADFNSLLSENGQEDREAINYDEDESLASDETFAQ